MSKEVSEAKAEERRGFFRIEDDITFRVRKVEQAGVGAGKALEAAKNSRYMLANELERMKAESRIHFRNVEKEAPEIARYLAHLEQKIDIIAQAFILDSEELAVQKRQLVSISGSGMAFDLDESFEIGSTIEVTLIFHPSLMAITTEANIKACDKKAEIYRTGIEFKNISDEDRDLLIRYVVKKQMNDIRNQKT